MVTDKSFFEHIPEEFHNHPTDKLLSKPQLWAASQPRGGNDHPRNKMMPEANIMNPA